MTQPCLQCQIQIITEVQGLCIIRSNCVGFPLKSLGFSNHSITPLFISKQKEACPETEMTQSHTISFDVIESYRVLVQVFHFCSCTINYFDLYFTHLCKMIESAKQLIEGPHQVLRRHGHGQCGKALNVSKQDTRKKKKKRHAIQVRL